MPSCESPARRMTASLIFSGRRSARSEAGGADVHFVAGEGRRGVLRQFAPARAGDECEHDHERAEHSATNSFHGFRLPPPDDAPQAEMMGASMPAMLPQDIPRGPST